MKKVIDCLRKAESIPLPENVRLVLGIKSILIRDDTAAIADNGDYSKLADIREAIAFLVDQFGGSVLWHDSVVVKEEAVAEEHRGGIQLQETALKHIYGSKSEKERFDKVTSEVDKLAEKGWELSEDKVNDMASSVLEDMGSEVDIPKPVKATQPKFATNEESYDYYLDKLLSLANIYETTIGLLEKRALAGEFGDKNFEIVSLFDTFRLLSMKRGM